MKPDDLNSYTPPTHLRHWIMIAAVGASVSVATAQNQAPENPAVQTESSSPQAGQHKEGSGVIVRDQEQLYIVSQNLSGTSPDGKILLDVSHVDPDVIDNLELAPKENPSTGVAYKVIGQFNQDGRFMVESILSDHAD